MRSERSDRKPAWWALYAIALHLVALIGVIERFMPAGAWRTVLECVVVTVMFTLMLVWRRHNRAALDLDRRSLIR
jgi:hypothetical protein